MTEPTIKDEAKQRFTEPLLPLEKKLVAWSLGLGIALLIILAVINRLVPI